MRPITEWNHVWVEWHVRFWERVGLTKPVRVPRWYAKLWNYPDSAWRGPPMWKPRYKSSGYHVGHWTAVLLPVAVVVGVLL